MGGRGLEDKGPGGKEGKKVGSNALPRSVPGSPRIGKKNIFCLNKYCELLAA